ncbi:c-type cytochrome [Occallatibacter riparius]|uniref:Cytochrome c n=1 Tax=Occallatibacter riparius TaxID=1002689 RepID=A0A9J7BMX6_9BACT|nr:cytochrome c [Occallatibacter riparius]UWZ82533.1 cytochrome c [Occallatibacter riparius]
MRKPLLLLPAVLVMAYAGSLVSQQKPAHKPAPSEAAPPATIQVEPPRPEVKQIYKNDCAICHGDTGDGKGDIGKTMTLDDWTSPTALAGKSDEQLFNAIRKGSDGKMPPEDAARAKDNEIRGLVKYIRGMAKPGQPAAEPAAQPAATPAPASSSPTTK